MRRQPIEHRKAALASLLPSAALAVRLCEHIEGGGPIVFKHVCRMGLEGIVSKRKGSPWRSGRTRDWLKSKNPSAPAVRREAEEDWR
jgi:bifunctional non-homologous end joining protein LigD